MYLLLCGQWYLIHIFVLHRRRGGNNEELILTVVKKARRKDSVRASISADSGPLGIQIGEQFIPLSANQSDIENFDPLVKHAAISQIELLQSRLVGLQQLLKK